MIYSIQDDTSVAPNILIPIYCMRLWRVPYAGTNPSHIPWYFGYPGTFDKAKKIDVFFGSHGVKEPRKKMNILKHLEIMM